MPKTKRKTSKQTEPKKVRDLTPWQFKRIPEENRTDEPFDCVLTLRMDKTLREQIRSQPGWQIKVRALLREMIEEEGEQSDKVSV